MARSDAMTVRENCFIIDGVKVPKGNFSFVYDKLGDREVYNDLLRAEAFYRTDPFVGITALRRALEGFVLIELTRREEASTVTDPDKTDKLKKTLTYNNFKKKAKATKGFYKFEGAALFNNCGADYTDVLRKKYPACWERKDKPDEEEKKALIGRLLDDFYFQLSSVVHPDDLPYDDLQKLLYPNIRYLHALLAGYFQSPEEFARFRMPHGENYPLTPEEAKELDLPSLGEGNKRMNRFYALSEDMQGNVYFNILFRSGGKGMGELQQRQSAVLRLLWSSKNRRDPVNVLHSTGECREGEDVYTVCSTKSRPVAVNKELLSGLDIDERREMLDGVCGAVRSMHGFKPPFYHRHICPSAFIACPSGDSYQLFLIRLDYTKDISGDLSGTMNAYVHNLDEEMEGFAAPEVPELDENTKDAWSMTDIYSMGKVCIYILNGGVLPEQGKEMEALEKLGLDDEDILLLMDMISEDPGERPSIKEVASAFG